MGGTQSRVMSRSLGSFGVSVFVGICGWISNKRDVRMFRFVYEAAQFVESERARAHSSRKQESGGEMGGCRRGCRF